MALEPSKHVNGRMRPPSQYGNPNGRPVGQSDGIQSGISGRPCGRLGYARQADHAYYGPDQSSGLLRHLRTANPE